MDSCLRIRPLICSLAEGELAPDEAIRVARHLPDCTACRIVAAREQRLARMLEEDLDDLPVGEEFVRSVMATLPDGPPPNASLATRLRKARRGLKLASLFAVLTGAAWTLWHLAALRTDLPRPALPSLSPDPSQTIPEAIAGLVGFVLTTLEALAAIGRLPLDLPGLGGGAGLLAAAVGMLLVASAGAATLLLCAARLLVRPRAVRS